MTTPPTIPPGRADEVRASPARGAWSVRTAQALAYAVNPLVLPALVVGTVLAHFGAPAAEIGLGAGIVFVFLALAPLAYLARMVRRRQAATLELRDRRQRTRPFLFTVGAAGAALLLLHGAATTAGALVTAILACILVNIAALTAINLRWKISVHTAAAAGTVSVLLFVAHTAWPALAGHPAEALLLRPSVLYPFLATVPLLAWARVRTGAHTARQTLAGALFGLTAPYAELTLLLHAGLLAGA